MCSSDLLEELEKKEESFVEIKLETLQLITTLQRCYERRRSVKREDATRAEFWLGTKGKEAGDDDENEMSII